MSIKRCLLEMGMGVDLHEKDYTKAAQRAVRDALCHNNRRFPSVFGPDSMHVGVTISVPQPEAVEVETVLSVLRYGRKRINVILGGLEIPDEGISDATVIANAAVTVSLDV